MTQEIQRVDTIRARAWPAAGQSQQRRASAHTAGPPSARGRGSLAPIRDGLGLVLRSLGCTRPPGSGDLPDVRRMGPAGCSRMPILRIAFHRNRRSMWCSPAGGCRPLPLVRGHRTPGGLPTMRRGRGKGDRPVPGVRRDLVPRV